MTRPLVSDMDRLQLIELVHKLEDEVEKKDFDIDRLNEEIGDLKFKLECIPDLEHDQDDELDHDLFQVFETLIHRLGYVRFQQLLDEQMGKVEKYYGSMNYLRVR